MAAGRLGRRVTGHDEVRGRPAAADPAGRDRTLPAEPAGRDRIELRGMHFAGRHGLKPEEREHPQPFEVDVVLELDLGVAGRTDDLAATVDYGRVFATAQETVEGPHVDLIETLAERIAAALLGDHPAVAAVTVRVRKPHAPLPGRFEWAGVEIRRER